jgi:tRNA wybutosine-synthesizing protein 4
VPRVRVTSTAEFDRILEAAVPVILEGLDIGPCQEKWTNDYLLKEVGPGREVSLDYPESDP